MRIIGNDWDTILAEEFTAPYYRNLRHFLDKEYAERVIYPTKADLYNALRLTSYQATKVVLLGQDPYHEKDQAIGLAFAVQKGTALPPSLVNIYRELSADLAYPPADHGDLRPWAQEGVLLLNTVLTVREHLANSHKNQGWERLTDAIIKKLNLKETPLVFLLWGRNAQSKRALITNKRHLVLTAAHPSPLSAAHGFFGCRHFSKTNAFLRANQLTPIDWRL